MSPPYKRKADGLYIGDHRLGREELLELSGLIYDELAAEALRTRRELAVSAA